MTQPEILIVLEPGRMAEVLPALRAAATVTQVFPPRLLLLRTDETDQVAALAGVLLATATSVPAQVRADLTPEEEMFVAGWEARRRGKAERPGQGLPWDAPGFLPPDAPPDRHTGGSPPA